MAFYQNLVQTIDKTKPTEELLCCALMADLAYVRSEPVLENAMKLYLGTGDFSWHETPGPLRCNYVMTQNVDGIIVAFSGTENISQFLYYAMTSLNIARNDLNLARCHTGFADIASDVMADLLILVRPEWKFAPMTLIGHSLGGAVALIIAAMLKVQPGYDVRNIITFGAPAVGAFDFEGLIENVNKVSVVNEGDPVPYLPPEIGVKWRSPLTTPEIFAFYHFVPIFPWLTATLQGSYYQRESHFANLPRALLTTIWEILRDPNMVNRTVLGKEIEAHFMEFYESRIQQWLKKFPTGINWIFYDQMFAAVNGLRSPGQFVQEIPQSQFNSLVQALGAAQGLVASPPLPDDPYLAFYAWAAGQRPDVKVEVGLFTNELPQNEVKISDILEANFSGYRRAGNETWSQKEAHAARYASAQSALCTWVQSAAGRPQIARGVFVVMKSGLKQTLIGAQKFANPVAFGNIDAKVSGYSQAVAILSRVTGSTENKKAAVPGLYSFSYMLLTQMGASGEFTNFNGGIAFPNPFAASYDLAGSEPAGAARTWWQYRGQDRRMIENGLESMRSILKRDAKYLGVENAPPPILEPGDEQIQSAFETVINQLAFDLLVVRT